MTSTIKIQDEVEKVEGVTVFRKGRFRMVYIDTPSNWCSTLAVRDRPSKTASVFGMVYNGSGYVNCNVSVKTNGHVEITDPYGNWISGAQWGYLIGRTICYYV